MEDGHKLVQNTGQDVSAHFTPFRFQNINSCVPNPKRQILLNSRLPLIAESAKLHLELAFFQP